MNHSNVIITPQYPVLVSEYDNTAHVLVRLQAPEYSEKQTKRSNLNLAIVLDRSGSMSGRPIEEAKRCASFMMDQLSKEDRAAIVIYDDEVELLVPCTHVVNKNDFFMKLQLVHSRGMTNLHGGWLRGAEEIAQYASSDSITRVILLSDGLANRGLTDPDAIQKQCSELAQAGVTTSTYGLGNNFNEELMVGMARAGQGVPYYGETADDLLDPFQEEFSLLSSLFAKEIKMKLKSEKNVHAEILNQYVESEDGYYSMPYLGYGGEAWALIRLTIPKDIIPPSHSDTELELCQASFMYQDIDGNRRSVESEVLRMKSAPKSAWNAIAPDELVTQRMSELEAARINEQAQCAAQRGDWDEVNHLLEQARKNANQDEWLEGVVEKLESLAKQKDDVKFMKETHYSMDRMRYRPACVNELHQGFNDQSAPLYLRRKREQGKKS